jgi:predicted signal transduction protein with EAL and GGDEF domain
METPTRNCHGYRYVALAVLSITIGPILMAFRASDASNLEKFAYVTLFVPLGLIVMLLNYFREKSLVVTEADLRTQGELATRIKKKYVKYLSIYIPISLAYGAVCAWLLLGGKF